MFGAVIFEEIRKESTRMEEGKTDYKIESRSGEWPSCVPKKWGESPIGVVLHEEKPCNCGEHIFHKLYIGNGVWPKETRIKIVLKKTKN